MENHDADIELLNFLRKYCELNENSRFICLEAIIKHRRDSIKNLDDDTSIAGSVVNKVSTYNRMHSIAREKGFPSIVDALKCADRVKEEVK